MGGGGDRTVKLPVIGDPLWRCQPEITPSLRNTRGLLGLVTAGPSSSLQAFFGRCLSTVGLLSPWKWRGLRGGRWSPDLDNKWGEGAWCTVVSWDKKGSEGAKKCEVNNEDFSNLFPTPPNLEMHARDCLLFFLCERPTEDGTGLFCDGPRGPKWQKHCGFRSSVCGGLSPLLSFICYCLDAFAKRKWDICVVCMSPSSELVFHVPFSILITQINLYLGLRCFCSFFCFIPIYSLLPKKTKHCKLVAEPIPSFFFVMAATHPINCYADSATSSSVAKTPVPHAQRYLGVSVPLTTARNCKRRGLWALTPVPQGDPMRRSTPMLRLAMQGTCSVLAMVWNFWEVLFVVQCMQCYPSIPCLLVYSPFTGAVHICQCITFGSETSYLHMMCLFLLIFFGTFYLSNVFVTWSSNHSHLNCKAANATW